MSDELAGTTVSGPWFQGEQVITQGFRPGPGAYEPDHAGIDVGLQLGSSLFAGLAGTITDLVDPRGYGTYETLTPDENPSEKIILGHLSAQLVPSGTHVAAGDLIAYSGSTGNSTGPHLHLEDQLSGVPVDPLPRLKGSGAPAAPQAPGQGGGGLGDLVGAGAQAGLFGPTAWIVSHRDDVGKLAPQAAQALGLASIGEAIAGIPTTIGHGLADAAGATAHNFEVFAQKQIVALVVAIVVLLVLFL